MILYGLLLLPFIAKLKNYFLPFFLPGLPMIDLEAAN